MTTTRAIARKALLAAAFVAWLYAAWLMLQLTLPYLALHRGVEFLRTKENVYHLAHWRFSFYVHVFSALAALVCGLLQFSGYIIRRKPRLHRVSGYIYVVNVLLITGPAALVMSWYANGGWPAQLSFVLQSLCWLVFTAIAVQRAFAKKFMAHGQWMARSYALTLAALSLRSYALLLGLLHVHLRPATEYTIIAWASWVPNLLIAEWLIRQGLVQRILRKRASA